MNKIHAGVIGLLIVDWILPFAPIGSIVLAIAVFHRPFAVWLVDKLVDSHK